MYSGKRPHPSLWYNLGSAQKGITFLKPLYKFGNCQRPVSSLGVSHHLKAVDTIGNCQRPVSSLGVSHHLKAVDTIGNCQRLAFTVSVSQHMHKITNLWKFQLNRSSKLRDNNERTKHPCHTKLCLFRWLILRPQVLNLRSRNQIRGKLLLSRKLWHFRGSRFSQWFIPSNSPHFLSPRKVLW